MARLMLPRWMGCGDLAAHGFRSTFCNWVAEATTVPRELAEAALPHVNCDTTERVCARGDKPAKRARLMEGWADCCAKPSEAAGTVERIEGSRPVRA